MIKGRGLLLHKNSCPHVAEQESVRAAGQKLGLAVSHRRIERDAAAMVSLPMDLSGLSSQSFIAFFFP